jgi:hypothetical protein
MALNDPVDAYCERISPAFWAEPVNALTNLAFIAGAVAAYMMASPAARRDPLFLALNGVMALIGLGSFAFHTIATRGAALLDVIPIAVFIHLYFYAALRRLLQLSVTRSVIATIVFLVAGFAIGRAGASYLNGSIGYLPALLALGGMAIAVQFAGTQQAHDIRAPQRLSSIALLFLVSLSFRVVDQMVCTSFPLGTHFMWHVLNAAVLFLLLRLLADAARKD